MWTPGIIGLAIGLVLLVSIKDDPEQAGLPPIDEPAKGEQRTLHVAGLTGMMPEHP